MTRRDWWFGVAVLALVITAIASVVAAKVLFPRYEVRTVRDAIVRLDRWTGESKIAWEAPDVDRSRLELDYNATTFFLLNQCKQALAKDNPASRFTEYESEVRAGRVKRSALAK